MSIFSSLIKHLRIILLVFTIIVLLQQIAVVAVSGIFSIHIYVYGIVTIGFLINFIFTIFFFVAIICQYTTSKFVCISSVVVAGTFHFYSLFGIFIYAFNVKLIYCVIPEHFIQHITRTPNGCTTECKFEKDMSEENQTTATLIFILFNYCSGILYVVFATFSYRYYVKALKNEENLKNYPV